MDRLFRRSRLMREKWDQRHGGQTYGALTIATAIAGCAETYAPGRAEPAPCVDVDPHSPRRRHGR